MIERISALTRNLEENGFSIKGGSPFEAFAKAMTQLESDSRLVATLSQLDQFKLGEGMRIFFEVEIIAQNLLPTTDLLVRDKLQEALSGHILPSLDQNSRARNTMYELIIGAWLKQWGACKRRGVQVTFQARPDMLVTIGGRQFGLEAKRLSTPKAVRGELRKARHQLEEMPLPGIVAFDVDQLHSAGQPNPTETRLVVPSDTPHAELQQVAQSMFQQYLSEAVARDAKPPIVAIIVTDIARVIAEDGNPVAISMSTHVHPVPGADEASSLALQQFFQ